MTDYFSSSYRQGRARFLSAAGQAGGAIESFVHPAIKGPHGEDLAIDCARFGRIDAPRLLLASCGLHGLEAAAGSATMLQWLALGGARRLPDDMAVLLVHALNPYGWAYASRCNEDAIDLNRNGIDWSLPPPANPAYADIHAILLRHAADQAGLDGFTGDLHGLAAAKGFEWALVGSAAGQYAHPDGLSFGGSAQAWSTRTALAIAQAHMPRQGKVLMLDWHTGIGPWAEPYLILDAPGGGGEQALVASWWPERQVHCEDVVEGARIEYHGLLTAAVRDLAVRSCQSSVIGLTVEWGTYPVDSMIEALVMDNWLRHRAAPASDLAADVRAKLIDRFIPADPAWRAAVAGQSEAIYTEAIAGLAGWD